MLAYFLTASAFPLFDLDEGAFSQATLEMKLRGNYIATYLNDVPRYDKPILAYWSQLLFITVLGPTEFAFRATSIFAVACWACVIFATVARLYGSQQAFWACLIFMSSLVTLIVGKAATADSLLNLFIVITQIQLYFYLTNHKKTHLTFAAIAAGLGFMTKGPVAVLIPFLTILAFTVSERRWGDFIKVITSVNAWLIFVLIAFPWYVWITYVEGLGFIKGFIFEHNIGRFSQSMESHSGPIYFYLLVIPVMLLPHTFFLPNMIAKVALHWRHDSFIRFLTIWFLIVFVIFSFSATKLPHYLLYGLTPIFIILGLVISETSLKVWLLSPALFMALLAYFMPDIMEVISFNVSDVYLKDLLDQVHLTNTQLGITFLCIVVIVFLMFMLKVGVLPKFLFTGNAAYLITVVMNVMLVNWVFISLIAKIQQEPIREAADIAKSLNNEVVMWRVRMPSFSVYYGGVVRTAEPSQGQIFLTTTKHLKDIASYEIIFQKRGVILAQKNK